MAPESAPLSPVRRVVTTHNSDGKATILQDSVVDGIQAPHGPWLTPIWNTDAVPPDVNVTVDRSPVKTGIVNDGTVLRYVDLPPHSKGSVHRTISLDYILVLRGEIVLSLDDGSRTPMKEGDMCVQQATMHSWDNESDEWCRLLCILIHSQPPVVNGKALEANTHF
jgi:quercetin dioxygenase-like cupin family protein